MIIFINGAFGVGKTSAAKALRGRLRGSRLYDPGPVGLLLRHLSLGRHPDGRIIDDFQDMPVWRRATVSGLRFSKRLGRHTIVPMAFSNLDYFEEIVGGVRAFEPDIRCFCLTAPIEIVRQRLSARGVLPESRNGSWAYRRAAECCEAHQSPAFGEQIPTAGRAIDEVATELAQRLSPLKLTSDAGKGEAP